jgi:hypothetical protein
MKVGEIPIAYGFFMPNKAYSEAQKSLFLNANLYSASGCVVEPDSPKHEKTLYCETCREAESEWIKKNGKKP